MAVNGASVSAVAGQYAEIHRVWKPGDRVHVAFDMAPRLTAANALVREDTGRVAVERGPLVYCLEKPDQPLASSLFNESLLLTGPGGTGRNAPFTEQFQNDLLDGVEVLKHAGVITAKPLEDDPLYRDFNHAAQDGVKPVTLTFIPYYAWANRGEYEMEVWIPVSGPVNSGPINRANR
jgi:hypothetical protein